MALMKWEPSEGLATLQREVNRLFESFFDGSPWRAGEAMTAPAVEVADTKEAVVVKVQVPGVSKEQIQIAVSEGALTIKGETKEEEKKEEKNYIRREFHYGGFTRTIPLPAGAQAEKATAQLKDGVLEITIPKSEEARVKEIPISV
ncbi:MAG TPA: Hsp20/alpha crystallin family protein [Candidatus Tectomicrobia bacterium]